MKTKFSVLGAGSFGIALSKLIANNKQFEVNLWSALEEEIYELKLHGENKKYLPGIKLLKNEVNLTTNLNDVYGSDFIIFAVASSFIRKVAKMSKNFIQKNSIIINIAKGLEKNSFKRMSEVIFDEIGHENEFVALSGPSHAEEIARFVPTTMVAASNNLKTAQILQKTLSSKTLRIYINDDIIGVELGGALKNIIALAVGICDGLGIGENAKAALITRGIIEIKRIGTALGAKSQTFAGLSGLGDLIVTCNSMNSRNKRAGVLIGKGKNIKSAIGDVGMVVEGYGATETAFKLAQKLKISTPIINELYAVLYQNENAKVAISNLMNRPIKHEYESKVWLK